MGWYSFNAGGFDVLHRVQTHPADIEDAAVDAKGDPLHLTPDSNVAEHEGLSRAAAVTLSRWSGLPIQRSILAALVPEQDACHDRVLRPHRPVAGPAAIGQELELRHHVHQVAREQVVPVTITEPGDTIAPYLGAQLNAFRARILASNRPGDLDGLCARHIMGDRRDIGWDVDPLSDSWLADNAERLDDAGPLASVGYALTALTGARPDMMPRVRAALGRFMQRDHLRIGGPTFLHDTRTLLGIALVIRGVRPEMPEAATWLAHTLSDPRLKPAKRLHELIRSHVLTAIHRSACRAGPD